MDQDRRRDDTLAPPVWLPDQQLQYRSVQSNATEGGIRRAKSAQEVGPQAAHDEATAEALRKLASVEVGEGERNRLKEDVKVARKTTRDNAQFNRREFWNRMRMVQTAASPWPCGLRDTYIQMVASVHGVGLEALQELCKLWAQDEVTEEMASIWTKAIVHSRRLRGGPDSGPLEEEAKYETCRMLRGVDDTGRDGNDRCGVAAARRCDGTSPIRMRSTRRCGNDHCGYQNMGIENK